MTGHRVDPRFNVETPMERPCEVDRFQPGAVDIELQQPIVRHREIEEAVLQHHLRGRIGHRMDCVAVSRVIVAGRASRLWGTLNRPDGNVTRTTRSAADSAQTDLAPGSIDDQAEAAQQRGIGAHRRDHLMKFEAGGDVLTSG